LAAWFGGPKSRARILARLDSAQLGKVLLLLLCGGDKSTQARDIGRAQRKTKRFDTSAFLDDDEVVAEYLTAALEDPNPDVFLTAIGQVAKARGMSAIAEGAGLGRESLYKALTLGAKPRYDTVLKVLQSLAIKVSLTAA